MKRFSSHFQTERGLYFPGGLVPSPPEDLLRSPTAQALRVLSPASSMPCFTLEISTSCRWKIPAASAAEAPVFSKTSVKCSGAPAPLLAMTGMPTAPVTMSTSSRSKPLPAPSRSMQFSRISPAPRASTATASS